MSAIPNGSSRPQDAAFLNRKGIAAPGVAAGARVKYACR
jgi:hypothetical protein